MLLLSPALSSIILTFSSIAFLVDIVNKFIHNCYDKTVKTLLFVSILLLYGMPIKICIIDVHGRCMCSKNQSTHCIVMYIIEYNECCCYNAFITDATIVTVENCYHATLSGCYSWYNIVVKTDTL